MSWRVTPYVNGIRSVYALVDGQEIFIRNEWEITPSHPKPQEPNLNPRTLREVREERKRLLEEWKSRHTR
jgi:hypothetical protein